MTHHRWFYRSLQLIALLAVLILPATANANGQVIYETQRLAPDTLDYIDHFGYTLALDKNLLLVPAEYHEPGGAVYIFERDQKGIWQESPTVLQPDRPVQYGSFACSIAIRDSTAFVGANNYPNGDKLGAGAVYVFDRSESGTWMQVEIIQPQDAEAFDNFGVSVAVEGQILAVGSVHSTDYGQTSLGAVYIFEEDGNGDWHQTAKLAAEEPSTKDGFGWTLSLSGNTLLVGDLFKEVNGLIDAGIVYVFERGIDGKWNYRQALTTGNPQVQSYFGLSLALHGDRAVIGAPLKRQSGVYSGAAYVFESDASGFWNEKLSLLPADPTKMSDYGWAIALNEDGILVGSPGGSTVYLFSQVTGGLWNEVAQFQPSNPGSNSYLGRSVAISKDQAFAGQFPMTSGYGSVHVFDLPISSIWRYHTFLPVVDSGEILK